MLIGDVIVSARELYPDLPGVVPPPTISSVTPIVGDGSVGAGPYAIGITFTTLWGETTMVTTSGTIVGPNNSLQVVVASNAGFLRSLSVITGVNIYLSSTLIELPIDAVKYSFPGANPGTVLTISTTANPVYQPPPNRSTAFNPDTNGRFVAAGTVFRWINEALNVAAYICKGIPDVSGVQMVSGQGFYTMPGVWDKLENCWFDGYPVAFDARGGAFYRNVLSGITFICILQTSADRQIVELQPQPSRSGGSTTLSAPIGLTDTTIPLTSTAQMGLSLGMVQIGTEVVSYGSLSGGNLQGCARGLGGTQQQSWIAGTVVNELNFRFGGLRLNQQVQYQPGQSLTTLQVPPGWQPALVDYLVGRFREAEQNSQGKGESIKAFTSFCKEYLKGTKQTGGPRQVGAVTPAGDGYPSASSGGRIIVP